MNKVEANKESLCEFVLQAVAPYNNCPSIEQFVCKIIQLELNIQSLEARVQIIQREVSVLGRVIN